MTKPASRVLNSSDRVISVLRDDSDDEQCDVVLVQPRASNLAFSTKTENQTSHVFITELGWDSMCSLHVASSLSIIPGAAAIKRPKSARGMGGVRNITHKGKSDVFGKTMSYIDGGETPNLLSVGTECQVDDTGLPGMALFGAQGAVRFRVTPDIEEEFLKLVDRVEKNGMVQGVAVLRNNVYLEAFGNDGPVDPESVMMPATDINCAVSHNMFANRIHLDSVDNVLDFMVASGLNQQSLLEGIKNQSLRGIPPAITEDHVKQYFKNVGPSNEQLEAEIFKSPLSMPVDYEVEKARGPGAILQIDNVDPSFSRLATAAADVSTESVTKAVETARKAVVPSIGGYKDAVIGIDEATGYAHIVGRTSKKDPHKILALFLGKWQGRWGAIKFVKGDKEFLTHESMALLNAMDVRFRQAVPGDHRRTTNMVEGCMRWIQEVAQANMNRLKRHVKDKVITDRQARTMWFHALRQAVFVFNFRPSLWDPGITRYQMGTGDIANLSNVVLMPFGTRVMGKNLLSSADGRGSECLYIGPSSTVRGGILTYSLATDRVSVKYAFRPIPDVRRPAEAQVRKASKEIYGPIKEIAVEQSPQEKSPHPGWEEVKGFDAPVPVPKPEPAVPAEIAAEPLPPVPPDPVPQELPANVPATDRAEPFDMSEKGIPESSVTDFGDTLPSQSGGGLKKPPAPVKSDYNTRHRAARVLTVEEEAAKKAARPPKPKVPPGGVCDQSDRWIAAEAREVSKLIEEETTIPLPLDEHGRPVRPKNAIVLRLLKIREWKWKPDPVTGVEGWLECVRIVCDGSKDDRPEKFYAETPDRTLLFLMASIEASLGIGATGSDVTRAYLNAQSIDRNIVILAPKGLRGFPRESLLNKGLYGSKGGALSWQVWIDEKMAELKYVKLQLCRGVYKKKLPSGEIMRAYRHSDDFRMSSVDVEGRVIEEKLLREIVRMSEFTNIYRFLGCTFEYIDAMTGLPDPNGTIVLVRQTDKIREMETKFAHLRTKFNAKGRTRKTALPVDAIRADDDLDDEYVALLSSADIEVYQSVGGCIQWIVGSTRHEAKLGAFLLSTRMAKPRVWDMYIAVYVMDYLASTADAPLVLGGPVIDPVVFSDASFASLPESRSIMGHCVITGEGSGAIYANVTSTRTAVTSIFEAELMAGCSGIDSSIYVTNACNELEYNIPQRRTIKVDNQAEVDWVKGSVSNKRSRHIDVRYYRSRQLQELGEVSVEHISTENNIADILTKPLVYALFIKFARMILGHCMVLGKGIKGIFEAEVPRSRV